MKNLNKILIYASIACNLNSCNSNNNIRESEKNKNLEITIINQKKEIKQLHLDLIKRDNPYEWKLNCDEQGGCWYERSNKIIYEDTAYEYLY